MALYILFGGRFGFGCSGRATSTFSSWTAKNNARSTTFPTSSSQSSADFSTTNTATTYTDYYGQWKKAKKQKQSFHLPNLFDGSVFSMICLAAILYACQTLGIQMLHCFGVGINIGVEVGFLFG